MNVTYTLDDIPRVASKVLKELSTKTVLFYGDMGVGKTTLIKALAAELQVEDTITSPTFSIVNEYKTPEDKIYHFDFYRISSIEEAMDIGVEEYLDSGNWVFIEWPDKIKDLLPIKKDIITITTIKQDVRNLTKKSMN